MLILHAPWYVKAVAAGGALAVGYLLSFPAGWLWRAARRATRRRDAAAEYLLALRVREEDLQRPVVARTVQAGVTAWGVPFTREERVFVPVDAHHRAPDTEPAPATPVSAPPAEPTPHEGATEDWSPLADVVAVGEGHLEPDDWTPLDTIDADAERLHAEAVARITAWAAAPITWADLDLAPLATATDRAVRVISDTRGVLAENTGAIDLAAMRRLVTAATPAYDFRAFGTPTPAAAATGSRAKRLRHRANRAAGAGWTA